MKWIYFLGSVIVLVLSILWGVSAQFSYEPIIAIVTSIGGFAYSSWKLVNGAPASSAIANPTEARTPQEQRLKGDNGEVDRDSLIDSMKLRVQILFIDDDKDFNVVKILRASGWKNTRSVVDIKSVDIQVVRQSDICFVDINGVGKLLNCEYEGLDLALMLKQRYPQKKVVIYSANKNSNSFHKAWDLCDYKLEKNALPYQFQNLVEEFSLALFK